MNIISNDIQDDFQLQDAFMIFTRSSGLYLYHRGNQSMMKLNWQVQSEREFKKTRTRVIKSFHSNHSFP